MLSKLFAKKTDIKRILVVDDEPGQVMVISKFLKHNGYEVITANDGLECIAKAENELPDLILLDNVMPNMDGQTALGKLRASEKTEGIPVIMVTALSSEENIASAQKGGAVEYVVKPFDYTVLLEKIAKALKSKRNGS
ncbi:MAG: response regulator [Desulfobacteraceae bacterium]|nr:response regulator [Desulfobacteraceae bacterium]